MYLSEIAMSYLYQICFMMNDLKKNVDINSVKRCNIFYSRRKECTHLLQCKMLKSYQNVYPEKFIKTFQIVKGI